MVPNRRLRRQRQRSRRDPVQRRPIPSTSSMPEMPTTQPPSPNFLPATPGYEQWQRNANDQLTGTLGQINARRGTMPGQLDLFKARQGTNVGYQTGALKENVADRGVFDSSITPYLQQRDIDLPAARESQDFAFGQQELLNQLAQAESQAYLGYNQSQAEALLQRAADAAAAMPLGLPQWGSNFGTPSNQRPERSQPRRRRRKRNGQG